MHTERAGRSASVFPEGKPLRYQALLVALAAERMLRRAHHDRATPDARKTNAPDVMYAIAGLGGHLPRNGDPAGSRWVVGSNDA